MYRYAVTRRWRQADGTWGDYIDFRYAKGLKEVRELCGNIGKAKHEFGIYNYRTVYSGDDGKLLFRAVNCGKWK